MYIDWINVFDDVPIDNIDVEVRTTSGVIGIARYWGYPSIWLTNSSKYPFNLNVKEWRYRKNILSDAIHRELTNY